MNIPEADIIATRKKLSEIMKQAEEEAKPECCILCGRKVSSFCNSHSVPGMVLKSITENGMVLHASAVIGINYVNNEDGIKKSGTFHFICDDCDNTIFKDYEDPQKLLQYPSDKMLAEIALKDILLQLSKRAIEMRLNDIIQDKYYLYENPEAQREIKALDVRDYNDDLELLKGVISNNEENVFHVLFWKKLPYKVPLALQSAIALEKDLNENQINNVFDMDEKVRISNMHLCVFPINGSTIILAFSHKRDRKYRGLKKQLVNTPDDKCLEYLNWLIFKYTENYYLSKNIKSIIETDPKLRQLSQESNGYPNLGFVDTVTMIQDHTTVKSDEIPNFLEPKYVNRLN